MNIGLCVRIVGLLLMLFSLGTLPSMTLGWVQNDGTASVFGQAFAATASSGVFLWLATQRVKSELQIRDGFMVTADSGSFWVSMVLCRFYSVTLWTLRYLMRFSSRCQA